ncbi:MAG: CBS domain-containing protein [Planctomycetota bacterium]
MYLKSFVQGSAAGVAMRARRATQVRVRDVMTNEVRSCSPETSLAVAAAIMWEGDCGALPVVENGRVTGIITDRDVCITLGTRDRLPRTVLVRDAGTTSIIACAPDDDLRTALDAMGRCKVRRLPVVDAEQQIRGIVSLNDIILRADRMLGNALSYDEVTQTLKCVCAHRS